jgi:hypothetical protein
MTDAALEPRTPSHPAPVLRLPRQRRREMVPGQAARAPARLAARLVPRPWMLPADPCYPRPTTSTRVSSISLLRPRMACTTHAVPGEPGVSRHLARRSEPARLSREAFPPPFSSVRTDLRAPLSRSPSGSRLPRGEPGCQSALADDTPGERRDRFDRRSVKIDDFPDPGHLPSWSTLRGCSTQRMTLPSPPRLSPFRSPRRRIAGGETSGHDGRGCPLARRFARSGRRSTTSAIRIRRAGTPRTPRSPLSGMPSGTPVGARRS